MAGAGGEAGAGGSGAGGGVAVETAMPQTVTDYATGDAIEGASVCNTANEGCSTSNAEGIAEFEYAVGTDILVTVDAEIYFGAQLNAQLTANEDGTPNTLAVALVQRAAAELVVATAPEPVDITNAEVGHIIAWSTSGSGISSALVHD